MKAELVIVEIVIVLLDLRSVKLVVEGTHLSNLPVNLAFCGFFQMCSHLIGTSQPHECDCSFHCRRRVTLRTCTPPFAMLMSKGALPLPQGRSEREALDRREEGMPRRRRRRRRR